MIGLIIMRSGKIMLMKKRVRLSISPIIILFFLIFALFLYFRFSNFQNRVAFSWDQEQYSFQIKKIIVDHKPALLGPRTTNDKGFFLAPYFTYIMVPFYLITNLHPSAIYLFLITYNLAFFVGTYFILRRLFHQYVVLLFLFLWSTNPALAAYEIIAWWPIYIPIATLIVWMLLKNIYDHNQLGTWFILGSIIGLFMHMHIQFMFIIVFVTIVLFKIRNHSKPNFACVFLLVLPIILSFTPLVIFDLRHQFLNFKSLYSFITQHTYGVQPSTTAWVPVFTNFVHPLIIMKSSLITIVFYFCILAMQVILLSNKKGFIKFFYGGSIALWIIFPILFGIYGQRPSEYYFIFLSPFIYVVIADFFFSIKRVPLFLALIIFIFIMNFKQLQMNLNTDYYSLKYKDQLVRQLAEKIKGRIFNLSYTTKLTADYGFRYLVDYYKLNPTGNWKDPLIQIKIPVDNQCAIRVANMGVIIPKELSH